VERFRFRDFADVGKEEGRVEREEEEREREKERVREEGREGGRQKRTIMRAHKAMTLSFRDGIDCVRGIQSLVVFISSTIGEDSIPSFSSKFEPACEFPLSFLESDGKKRVGNQLLASTRTILHPISSCRASHMCVAHVHRAREQLYSHSSVYGRD